MDTTSLVEIGKNIGTSEVTVLINAVLTAAFLIYKFYRRFTNK